MEIKIVSKAEFAKNLRYFGIDDTNVEAYNIAFICIEPTLEDWHHGDYFYFKKDHSNVLNIQFDDTTPNSEGKGVLFTEEHAKEVIEFIKRNEHRGKFILHCTAGINRSGSIGKFIADYFGVSYDDLIRVNPFIHGNWYVEQVLNKVYREQYANI